MQKPRDGGARATLEDFLAIPEEQRFHELIDGAIVDKASPSVEHGAAQAGLSVEVAGPFGRPAGPRGPGGWWFAVEVEVRLGDLVVRPDLVGWRRDRHPARPTGVPAAVAPDWICEVLSTNRSADTVRKKRLYHQHHVDHYWILDPEAGVLLVYRWHADGYLEVLAAERGDRVRAEPFQAIELSVSALLGDDEPATEEA